MNATKCPQCKRTFKNPTSFQQHLRGASNVLCYDAYYGRKLPSQPAKRAPEVTHPKSSKKRVIDRIERLLKQAPATTQPTEPTDALTGGGGEASETLDYPEPDVPYDEEPPATVDDEPVGIDLGEGLSEGLDAFRTYLAESQHHHSVFKDNERAAVELMSLMDTKGGSIALYEAIMDWHLNNLEGQQHPKLSADNLHDLLIKRYRMEPVLPSEIMVKLDSEEGEVPIVIHDCAAQTIDLLSDPRIEESDYLFPGDDPEGALPLEWEHVADIDSGRGEPYNKLIRPNPHTKCGRRRVLCPYIFYLDGCVTGQTQNQEVEILKFTVGLLNQRARRQKWAWRELGIVHHAAKGKGAAKNIVKESDHLDAQDYVEDLEYRRHFAKQEDVNLDDFGLNPEKETLASCIVAQDPHRMLRAILRSYKKVEDAGGIDWDLRKGGRTRYLRLVPFIIFLKVDGEEADKVCLQYTNKSERVQAVFVQRLLLSRSHQPQS